MEVSKKDAGSDQGLAPQKLCCAHDVRVLMPTQDHGDPDQIRDGNAVALCLAAAAVPPVCTLHCVLLDMHRTYLPHPSSCHRGARAVRKVQLEVPRSANSTPRECPRMEASA